MRGQRSFLPSRWIGFLFLLLTGWTVSAQQNAPLSPPPGRYADTVIVQNISGYSLVAQFAGEELQPFDFVSPLVLDALPGQENRFSIQIESQNQGVISNLGSFEYIIDRRPPRAPLLSPEPSVYRSPTVVSISGEGSLTVRLNGEVQAPGPVSLPGRPGQIVEYLVQAEAQDDVGNRSTVVEGRYRVDRRTEPNEESALAILSPQPGSYLNPQLLYIQQRGLTQVFYSLDGSDPLEGGMSYTQAVELSGSEILLQVAGVGVDGQILRESVRFSAGNESYQGVRQGINSNPVEIEPLYPGMTYTTTERIPTPFDPNFERTLRISPQANTLRSFVIRLRRTGSGGGEYRLFFLLEGRPLPHPRYVVRREDGLRNLTYPVGEFQLTDVLVPLSEQGYSILISHRGRTAPLEGPTSFASILSELGFEGSSLEESEKAEFELRYRTDAGIIGPSIAIEAANNRFPESDVQISQVEDGLNIELSGAPVFYSFSELPEGLLASSAVLRVPEGYRHTGRIRFWSRSSSGVNGAVLEEHSFDIDKQFPPGPRIVQENRSFRIESPNPSFYRIVSTSAEAPSRTDEFQPYAGPVDLLPIEGSNIVYRIEAYSSIREGERSTISRSPEIFVNDVLPPTPRIIGIAESQIYADAQIGFALANREPGFQYEYEVQIGGQILSSGEVSGGRITLDVPVIEADGVLRIRATSREEPTALNPLESSIRFTVDRVPPEQPRFVGPADGTRSGQTMNLSIENPEPGESIVLYRLQGTDDEEQIYAAPLSLDAAPETEVIYQIEALTLDRAGNRSEPIVRKLIVDRLAPPPPSFTILTRDGAAIPIPAQRVVHVNSDVVVLAESAGTIYFELESGPATPGIPGAHSSRFEEPIIVESEEGEERRVVLLARAVDAVGNWSSLQRLLEVRVDKRPPPTPSEPRVTRDGNTGILEWVDIDEPVYYRLGTQRDFRRFSGPVSWSIPPGVDEIQVVYKSIDGAGNESPAISSEIHRRNQTDRPIVQSSVGATAGSEMPTISVEATKANAQVRFEVILDSRDRDVTESSPEWSPQLLSPPVDGETLNYLLRFRQFEPGFEPSEPVSLRFTVDRTPPLPPSSEAALRSLHRGPTSLELVPTEGEILYRVQEEVLAGESPPEFANLPEVSNVDTPEEFTVYSQPILLPGRTSESVRYIVQAISRDTAGNASTKARTWEVLIDRDSVFVAAGSASVGDGTRENPFSDLNNAIEYADANEANRIFLRRGVYALSDWIGPDTNLSIVGGFDSDWVAGGHETLIVPAAGFRRDSLVLAGPGSSVELDSVYLTDPNEVVGTLINVAGGTFRSRQGLTLASPGSFKILSVDSGGSAQLRRSEIVNYESGVEKLIDVANGSLLSLEESLIEYREPPAFLRITGSRVHTSISVSSSRLRISDTRISAHRSQIGTSIQLEGSSAEFINSTINVPASRELALGVYAIDSSVTASGLQVLGNETAAISALLRIEGGSFEGNDLTLQPSASTGSTGIVARNSNIRITDSEIVAGTSEEYITIVQMSNSDLDFSGNSTSGNWNTAELIFAALESVSSSWRENNLDLQNSGSTLGFHLVRGGNTAIIDNEAESSGASAAIYLADPQSELRVENNIFRGWDILLVKSTLGETTAITGESVFSDILSLEAETEDGQIFSGNRVDQGL